ncbi:MAG TPA: NAD-binding protein [Candidatus Cybelea sp.]|nr:NAD-binding protein [Candidatus Cybelea sp.]
MYATPLILVVGDDRLTEEVCAALVATVGHQVRVVWALDDEREAVFRRMGVPVTALAPTSDDALLTAGVADAASILTLSPDDGLNLSVALRARILNPRIRLVLRQFDTVLGRKLERNLADCTVLSPSVHAAQTYAGGALDNGCLYAIRFPENEGPLVGFTQHSASALGVDGLTVSEAEKHLRARIVALGAHEDPPASSFISSGERITLFGCIVERREVTARRTRSDRDADTHRPRPSFGIRDVLGAYSRINPILRLLAVMAAGFFTLSYCFFHFSLGKTWTAAAFYVVETMTNVGFGEVAVTRRGPLITAGAIVAMLGGIVFTSIFIGYVSSALTRAQWIAMQGLRRIRARDHVVVCGAGKVGTAVVNLLTAAGKKVVIIEPQPGPDLVRRARERNVVLLTGDALGDGALDLCDITHATAALTLTDSDTANLEIALGARARAPGIPLVVRMEEPRFAHATAQLLGISTFSPTALSAPVFAGLARFPGTRGRLKYGGDDHTIGQRVQGEVPERPPARECTALCVWRRNELQLIHTFEEMEPFDVVLFSVPLGQFRAQAAASAEGVGANA